jgi:hypothetical protein
MGVELVAVPASFVGLAANLEELDDFSVESATALRDEGAKAGASTGPAVADSRSAGVSGVSAAAAGTGAGAMAAGMTASTVDPSLERSP